MKRKDSLLIFCATLALVGMLAGCAFKDIDKRFFVVSMGIDDSDNPEKPFRVSLKLAIPSAQVQPGKANFQIISENADSIAEAVRVMKSKVDKDFDFGHCRVIIFDRNILKRHQPEVLNWFMRRSDIQGIAYLAIGKPTAEMVLRVRVESERLAGNALIISFDQTTNTSPYIVSEILNDYYMRFKEDGIDPYLPVIEALEDTYVINKVALTKGEKVIGELNKDQTRVLNELLNTKRRGQINVRQGDNEFFVNVNRFKTKINLVIPKRKKPYVQVNLKIEGLIEASEKKLEKNYELLEDQKLAAEIINKRVEGTLKKIQEMGADPLGLGLMYQVKQGVSDKEVKKWENLYPTIEFKVKTDLKLRGTGTMY